MANRDLWEPFIELVQQRDVTFAWVKGHSGDPMNDLVDRLAVATSATDAAPRATHRRARTRAGTARRGPTRRPHDLQGMLRRV